MDMNKIRTKIFYASFPSCASDYVNQWLNDFPNVEVVALQYQQARYGDHSIFVVYRETEEE